MTLYVDIDMGQNRLRRWLVAWQHEIITWTNIDLSWIRSSEVYLRSISQEIPQLPNIKFSLKMNYLFFLNFPSASELVRRSKACKDCVYHV